jgi:type II secretion system protein J
VRSHAHAPGFTLLEILISIAITAMLVATAITAFRGIIQIQDRARPERNRAQSARVLLDRLENELLGTMLIMKKPFAPRLRHPWLFVGEDRAFGTNDSGALRFITSNPARPPGETSETGIRMITYAVGAVGADDRLALYRSEQRLPRGMQKRIDLKFAVPVIHDLVSMRLRYLDAPGWRDDWDSTDLSQLDRLPLEIEISLKLYEKQSDGTQTPGPEYTRTVSLPVRPLTQAAEGLLDPSCPGGLTLRGCIKRLQLLISKLPKSQRNPIVALRRNAPDLCWAPKEGSETLDRLKNALREALHSVPDEICG